MKKLILIIALLLQACGGGSGSEENPTTPEAGASGTVRVKQTISQSYTGTDALPFDSNDFVPVTAIPNTNVVDMSDNNTTVSAFTATATTNDHNIIIQVNNNPVDLIYAYTDAPLGAVTATGINGWELYTNSVVNVTNWTDESIAISSVVYNVVNRRYEMAIDGDASTPGNQTLQRNYLKLHFNNTLGVGQDVHITEIEASYLWVGIP